jgi:ferrous iron transport protein B
MTPQVLPRLRRVAFVGNPNTGKSTLFNALTGLSQHVGNYPGVTVEKKTGMIADGWCALDLPGAYSLAAHSPDQRVAVQVLAGDLEGEPRPDLVVSVLDAQNLERNLYLFTQMRELGIPVVVALNMVDAAERAGVVVDVPALSRALGVPVVPTVATRGTGVDLLRDEILRAADRPAEPVSWRWPKPLADEIDAISSRYRVHPFLAARALVDEGGAAQEELGPDALPDLRSARARVRDSGASPAALEARMRYGWIRQAASPCVRRKPAAARKTESIDRLLLHRLFGSVIFVALMSLVFVAIFQWAAPIMDAIDGLFGWIGAGVAALFAGTAAEGGVLQSLLVDGVVAGTGSVLIFLPQIVILFLFIALLEDCGYMARAAFLMDRLLRFCGLGGQSVIPLMSSFTCAVPGILATRTISDPRDRLLTILVSPLMSCSARIPVYAILTAAFVPEEIVLGFLPLQGLVFAGMYFVGILAAIPVAWLLKATLLKGASAPFVMELPPYQWPGPKTVALRVYQAARGFVVRAGTIILAISIVIWALSAFPRSPEIARDYQSRRADAATRLQGEERDRALRDLEAAEAGERIRGSVLGTVGRTIEPAVVPLGWDWRIGMAVVASFPAREVVVSTLRIIYDLEAQDENPASLTERLKGSKWPDGRPLFTLPVALSLMVFFALCLQCGATVAVIRRETRTWKWPLFAFFYMSALAYLGAFAAFHLGSWL